MSRVLPHCRLLMVPGAGHFLPIEQPIPFQMAALAFAGGVDAGGNFVASKCAV
jgi:pimeloyl-ACP methyl ester carboxylesterase